MSRIGHPLRNDRTHAEKSPVRQARHEPHRQEHPKVGCQRSADVTQNNKTGKSEQNPLQRPFTCNKHRRGSPDANPDGIGRNQIPGPGDGNAQIPRHIGQNPHHDELGHAESQRAESQGDQTLFHNSTLFTDGSALRDTEPLSHPSDRSAARQYGASEARSFDSENKNSAYLPLFRLKRKNFSPT